MTSPSLEDVPRLCLYQVRALPAWKEALASGKLSLLILDGEATTRVKVELDHDTTPHGARRHWLKCPGCGSRRRHLFWHLGSLRCRACHSLAYYEQTLPRNAWRSAVARPALRAARSLAVS